MKKLLLVFNILLAATAFPMDITFQWDPVAGADSYALYQCLSICPARPPLPGLTDPSINKLAAVTSTSATVFQSPGPKTYAVSSYNQSFASPFSQPLLFNVPVLVSGHISYCIGGFEAGVSIGGVVTDAQGYYHMTASPGSNVTLIPFKSGYAPRINTIDIVAIQQQLFHPSWSGCKLLSADANGDGRVDTTDIVALQRYILGRTWDPLGKFKFIPANATFSNVSTDIIQDFTCYVPGDVQ